LTSTSAPIGRPGSRAAALIASSPAAESIAIVMVMRPASAATRRQLSDPMISLARRMSSLTADAASASNTVAHVSPVHDPAASCRRAISGVL
jgi:hypothetical protein